MPRYHTGLHTSAHCICTCLCILVFSAFIADNLDLTLKTKKKETLRFGSACPDESIILITARYR